MNLYPMESWQAQWATDALFYLTNVGTAFAVHAGYWLPWIMTIAIYGAYYYVTYIVPVTEPRAELSEEELDRQQLLGMLGAGDGADAATVNKLEKQVRELKMRLDSMGEDRE